VELKLSQLSINLTRLLLTGRLSTLPGIFTVDGIDVVDVLLLTVALLESIRDVYDEIVPTITRIRKAAPRSGTATLIIIIVFFRRVISSPSAAEILKIFLRYVTAAAELLPVSE
jgi:hypothetical protein